MVTIFQTHRFEAPLISTGDIHSSEALRFMSFIGADSYVLNFLSEKLTIKDNPLLKFNPLNGSFEFCKYFEDNNRSARDSLDIVNEKIKGWLEKGVIEQLSEPPTYSNPLSLISKIDNATEKIKHRLALIYPEV